MQSSQGVLDFLMVLRVLRLVKIMGQIKRFVGFLFENFQLLHVINIWRVSAQSNPTFHFSAIFIHTWHKPSCFRRIHFSLCCSTFLRPPGPSTLYFVKKEFLQFFKNPNCQFIFIMFRLGSRACHTNSSFFFPKKISRLLNLFFSVYFMNKHKMLTHSRHTATVSVCTERSAITYSSYIYWRSSFKDSSLRFHWVSRHSKIRKVR